MNAICIATNSTRRYAATMEDRGTAIGNPHFRQTPPPDAGVARSEILVPMDFSECALNALRTAVNFAQIHEARITLVYVMDLNLHPSYRVDVWKLEQDLIAEAEANFAKTVASLPPHLRVDTKIVNGRPCEQILQVSRERGSKLIIMGKRKPSLWNLFRRQTVRSVTEKADCDVIVVAEEKKTTRRWFEKPMQLSCSGNL